MVLIFKILLVLFIVCIAAVLINFVEEANKKTNLLAFVDIVKELHLPIITIENNGNKFNFLLDTGSNYSIINQDSLPLVEHQIIEGATGEVYGMEGNVIKISYAHIAFKAGNIDFNDNFQVIDMSGAFSQLKETHNVEVIGILGSNFFARYNFVLDFKHLIAYTE